MESKVTPQQWIAEQQAFFARYDYIDPATGLSIRLPVEPMGTIVNVPKFFERHFAIIEIAWGNRIVAGPPIRRIRALRQYVETHMTPVVTDEEE